MTILNTFSKRAASPTRVNPWQCLGIITLVFTIMTFTATAQQTTLTYPETYIEAVVDAATLQSLSHEFSVDRVSRNADGSFNTRICLSYKDFDNFLSKEIPFTTMPQTRANVQMAQNYAQMTSSWNRYPTYSTYTAMMDTFRTRYPQLCAIDTILDDTPDHHKILVAHISNNLSDREGKPSVFYTSTIHGDEVVGYYLMLRLIDYLLTNYNTNTYVTNLVNSIDLWICPLHNPDGTYYTSDTQINSSPVSIRSNRHGVDLNRSFPLAGQNPAKDDVDEPEVQSMMQFLQAHDFTITANFHGGAEVFNYPWDTWTTWQHSHADASWWEYVGHNFADTCHLYNSTYMTEENNGVTEGGDWYVITGSMQDYHNWYLGTRHVTLEVCENKVSSTNRLPNYWNYTYRSLLNFIHEADNGIHGIVTDSLTGEPLEALVYIASHDIDHSYVETSLPYGDYHRPIKAGQYAVTYSAEGYLPKTIMVQVADGQKVVQDVQLTTGVGIDEFGSRVAVYPNPAKDFITVEFEGQEPADATAVLYNIYGKQLSTTPLQKSTRISTASLPAGHYILEINADGKRTWRKVAVGC